MTDSVQYREGTVKSTPARGVKQTLNPSASVQSKGVRHHACHPDGVPFGA